METKIIRADAVTLEGMRPRAAGRNARLGVHGDAVRLPVVRLVTAGGASGFGRSTMSQERLADLVGRPLDHFITGARVHEDWLDAELPLLDLAAHLAGEPLHRFAAGGGAVTAPIFSYDTSLYFDDLHLDDDTEAANLIASEALSGYERGHRAFKIKVGRGAMHMPLVEGTNRDITIIRAVREAVGPEATVMIDANNGWNLNLTRQVLAETADANLYWVEEPFHEDNVLFAELHAWLASEGLPVLIADGEGAADPRVVAWAREGLIDIVQTNIFTRGFGAWRTLASELHALGIQSSPHTYGGGISNSVAAQMAASTNGARFVEWDEARFAEFDASGYQVVEGEIRLPETPGLGLTLDEDAFAAAVARSGFTLLAP